ncbi:trehalose-phosphatase [Pseudactinotalea terrae]|uniref:trehalose-phosphatase n=1 Tax=Pseudactinotalea terrae TaxID=1743262 RepID=UPI0012E14A6B|nr:trehalose-phosphatase [Pseudactinotalea terrae]
MTLHPDLDAALVAFAAAPERVIALDFDGVLAPIVPRPEDAAPLAATRAALERLAQDPTVHLGLVSGRAAGDPALLRAAPPSTAIIGSHGAEQGFVQEDGRLEVVPPVLGEEQQALLERLRERTAELTAAVPGSWVEEKPTAIVVHTRPVPDAAAAAALEQDTLAQLGSLTGVRAIAGKRVVELSVAHATKGDAVTLLRTGFPARTLPEGTPLLYGGDDVTDEDAFAALVPGDLGIKVGDGETRATFRVEDPAAVGQVLARLAELAGM